MLKIRLLTHQYDIFIHRGTGEPTVLRDGPHLKGTCLIINHPTRTAHTGSVRADIHTLTPTILSSHCEQVSLQVAGIRGWGPTNSEG